MAQVKISFSGVGQDELHDGAMFVSYAYLLPKVPEFEQGVNHLGKKEYSELTALDGAENHIVAINYTTDLELNVDPVDGLVTSQPGGMKYSLYKREYQEFQKIEKITGEYKPVCTTYIGPWNPVALQTTDSFIRDFNITSGRSYQYCLYPLSGQTQVKPLFSNFENNKSIPVKTNWDEWSIAELIPVETSIDAPVVKKAYKVDLDNIWLFKYSLNTGEQTQNFQKQDIQTLGQYNRFGYGQQNFVSGNVSCLLGSEIVPYTKQGYIERRRQSIVEPLTTNEKIEMLRQWRKFAFSPNPKLLKDIKGQSWIVQIVSNSNSPQNFYMNQPDTISFSWKEMGDTDKVTIIGPGYAIPQPGKCDSVWNPKDMYPTDKRCNG